MNCYNNCYGYSLDSCLKSNICNQTQNVIFDFYYLSSMVNNSIRTQQLQQSFYSNFNLPEYKTDQEEFFDWEF